METWTRCEVPGLRLCVRGPVPLPWVSINRGQIDLQPWATASSALHHFPPTASLHCPPLPSTTLHCLHYLHYLHSPPPPPHKSLRDCTSQIPMGRHSMVIFRKRYILPITSTSNGKAFCPIRPALGPTRIIFSYLSAHTLTTCRRRCSLSPAILEVEKTRPLSSRED